MPRGINQWGSKNPNWKGGKYYIHGRKVVLARNCSRAFCNGYAQEHIVIAEKVLGKPLPLEAVIHHVNGRKMPNINSNLVICENENYHRFLHKRTRAYQGCRQARWVKCTVCKQYDDPVNLYIRHDGIGYHRKCKNIRNKLNRQKRRIENARQLTSVAAKSS